MNATNHCLERYHERVRKKNTPYTNDLRDRYSKELNELYEHSQKIYTGIVGRNSSKPVDVYVNKHGWVILSNDKEQNLITVYKIDLGIDNDSLNEQYITESLDKIERLSLAKDRAITHAAENKQEYETKISTAKTLIDEQRKIIEGLQTEINGYEKLIQASSTGVLRAERDLRDAIENYILKDYTKISFEEEE